MVGGKPATPRCIEAFITMSCAWISSSLGPSGHADERGRKGDGTTAEWLLTGAVTSRFFWAL
jgi:hypothetical protein